MIYTLPSQNHSAKMIIAGFGPMAQAVAQNAKDSGAQVTILLRPESPSNPLVKSLGFRIICHLGTEVTPPDYFYFLVQDQAQAKYYQEISDQIQTTCLFVVAHGYALLFGGLKLMPHHDVVLLAPKTSGENFRHLYLANKSPVFLLSEQQNITRQALQKTEKLISLLGRGAIPVLKTSLHEEVLCNLFSEQAVHCGPFFYLALASFVTLVKNGFSEEMAYLQCAHEMQNVATSMAKNGLEGFLNKISTIAKVGGVTQAKKLFSPEIYKNMQGIFDHLQQGFSEKLTSGELAKECGSILDDDWLKRFEATRLRLKPFFSNPKETL